MDNSELEKPWESPVLGPALARPAPCQLEQTVYRGWRSYTLSNDLIRVQVVPEIGGRIIQYELAGHPFFFVHPELAGQVFPADENGGGKSGWKNYGGSKLWPAPQGWERDDQWPGPPDPVLDGGAYQAEIMGSGPASAAIAVKSPPDPRTGIELGRTIRVFQGTTQVRSDCTMRNVSQRPVRWSIWEVVQHDATDATEPSSWNHDLWACCPINPRSVHPKGFVPLFGQVNHPSWCPDCGTGLFTAKYEYRVGKVGLDSRAGWLAVANGQTEHCFVAKFPWVAQAEYPDHSSVEFWLNGAGEVIINGQSVDNPSDPKVTPYLMESEILSPLIELEPGQEGSFRIDWFATRCPKPLVGVAEAGAIHQPLVACIQRAANRMRLDGVFGVFFKGQAWATFTDAFGRSVAREDLGSVQPDRVFRLQRELAVPSSAFRVSVNVIDSAGENRGWLGNVVLERH